MKCKITSWGIRTGTKIEMEHTSNPKTAKKIAFDHLNEFGDCYYKELIKMEKKLKR